MFSPSNFLYLYNSLVDLLEYASLESFDELLNGVLEDEDVSSIDSSHAVTTSSCDATKILYAKLNF